MEGNGNVDVIYVQGLGSKIQIREAEKSIQGIAYVQTTASLRHSQHTLFLVAGGASPSGAAPISLSCWRLICSTQLF